MGNKPVINVHFLSFNHQLRAVHFCGPPIFDAEKCLKKFSITCLFRTFLQQKLDPALQPYYLSYKLPVFIKVSSGATTNDMQKKQIGKRSTNLKREKSTTKVHLRNLDV